jgi:hypothetical protein
VSEGVAVGVSGRSVSVGVGVAGVAVGVGVRIGGSVVSSRVQPGASGSSTQETDFGSDVHANRLRTRAIDQRTRVSSDHRTLYCTCG